MKSSSIRARLLATGASSALLFTLGAEQVQAADASPAPETASAEIAEIVVTATRRQQALKDVPLSVQAVSPEALRRKTIQDTQDLSTLSPTLNFSTGNSANAQGLALRGVSSVAIQNGIQPSVAIVIDGVAIARQSEFIIDLGDIERIEILNGPQGTLFGKNSTAGVLNIVTQQPTSKVEAMAEAIVTNDEEYSIRTMINLPITDRLRLRATGFYRDQNPLIKNFTGPDVLGLEAYGANLKLAYDISDAATYTIAGTYSHTNSSRGQLIQVGGNVFGALYTSLISPAPIGRGTDVINTDSPAKDVYQSRSVSGTLNWTLNDHLDLVAITAYTKYKEDSIIDLDVSPQSFKIGKGFNLPGVFYPLTTVDYGIKDRFPDRFHYVSQEIRLNFHSDRWNTIVGGYFQDYHDRYQLKLATVLDSSLLGMAPGTYFFSLNLPRAKISDRTVSIFGDTTFEVTDKFKLFGGLRYTNEKVDVTYHRDVFAGPLSALNPITGVYALPPQTVDNQDSDTINNLSGRIGIQYQPDRALNLYASYARGYKGPAVDVGQTSPVSGRAILKPEIADAFELGAKLRVRRLSLNVALFHQTIHDIQISTARTGGVNLNPVLINGGKLRTKGVEAEGELAVDSHLRLSAGVAYNDATYGSFPYVCNPAQTATGTCPNYIQAGFQNIKGHRALVSPEWKYNLGMDYSGEFRSGLSYYLRTDWVWSSKIQYSLDNNPLTQERSHGMLNASVGLRSDHWEVQIFAKNLTNDFYYSNLNSLSVIGAPLGYIPRDYKRYGGAKLTLRY
ncbi:TonB-dependent receptor [Rhizorhabdus dicambivorans]|uniref:TonB-dependent receptor n=1 Tax=Rhizorhabdus dicambivorans TaxID=1850238 RepID=A0A2A4FVC3_9SPHN|nr:TonB-dependent receptor [Rhizorhabdus dicambivorans]ATE64717.1 TonB-dependent receptor [Rhizorhabdus dicambivorans]PCE41341.1 TonB-dependent receptor [Rhizorhabdus dicambivorans]